MPPPGMPVVPASVASPVPGGGGLLLPGETPFRPGPAGAASPGAVDPAGRCAPALMQRCIARRLPRRGKAGARAHSSPYFLSLRATVDWSTPSASAMRDWLW